MTSPITLLSLSHLWPSPKKTLKFSCKVSKNITFVTLSQKGNVIPLPYWLGVTNICDCPPKKLEIPLSSKQRLSHLSHHPLKASISLHFKVSTILPNRLVVTHECFTSLSLLDKFEPLGTRSTTLIYKGSKLGNTLLGWFTLNVVPSKWALLKKHHRDLLWFFILLIF